MIWISFKTTIDEQYVEMLARNSGTTLVQDGYAAYYAVAKEDTSALANSIIRYGRQSEKADTRVGELKAHLEAIAINPQPLRLGLPPQVARQ